MTGVLVVLGWPCFVCAAVAIVMLRGRLEAQARLVAEACHELRGPLCAARLAVESLEVDAPGLELELRRAGRALDDLAVARWGRRSAGCLEIVDLSLLAEEVAAGWEPLARSLGMELAVAAPFPVLVRADRVRLAQAAANLVANALEHGRGPVRIAVRRHDGRARLEVTDSGMGLPGPVASLPAGGTGERGHGLQIVRRVAEMHAGRLLTGPSRAGARLVLELPDVDYATSAA